jgi:hypothetical protein
MFVRTEQLVLREQLGFALVLLYMCAGFCIKMSICFFLRRMVEKVSPTWRNIVYITMLAVCLPYVVGFLLWTFSCRPIAAAWDFRLRLSSPYECLNPATVTRVITIIFAVGDIWLLTLPIVLVWRMRLSYRAQLGLTCVFALGGAACLAIVARIISVDGLYASFDSSCMFPIPNLADLTGKCFWVSIWTQLELTLGIISASLPTVHVVALRRIDQAKRSQIMARGLQRLAYFNTPETSTVDAEGGTKLGTFSCHQRDSTENVILAKPAATTEKLDYNAVSSPETSTPSTQVRLPVRPEKSTAPAPSFSRPIPRLSGPLAAAYAGPRVDSEGYYRV